MATRRQYGTTWWGAAWLAALEKVDDAHRVSNLQNNVEGGAPPAALYFQRSRQRDPAQKLHGNFTLAPRCALRAKVPRIGMGARQRSLMAASSRT